MRTDVETTDRLRSELSPVDLQRPGGGGRLTPRALQTPALLPAVHTDERQSAPTAVVPAQQ